MAGDDDDDGEDRDPDEVTVLEITDELDLHHFSPRDLKELIPDYIDEAVTRGFAEVRIVHGKGIGNLRRTVHALLERHPRVASFQLAGDGRGGWGATVVTLKLDEPPA